MRFYLTLSWQIALADCHLMPPPSRKVKWFFPVLVLRPITLCKGYNIPLVVGRGKKSHAYTHSVQEGHHVFLNLSTHKFYCLPDNYQIIDQSLEDIVVRRPVYWLLSALVDVFHLSRKWLHSKCLKKMEYNIFN